MYHDFDSYQKHVLDTLSLRDIQEREALSKGCREHSGLDIVFLYDEGYNTEEEDTKYIYANYGKQAFVSECYDGREDPDMLSCIINKEYYCTCFTPTLIDNKHIPFLKYSLFVRKGDETFYINLSQLPHLKVPNEMIEKYLRIYKSKLRNISINELLEG